MNTLSEIIDVIPEKHFHRAYTEYDVTQYVENNSVYSIMRGEPSYKIFDFIKFVLLHQKTEKRNVPYTLINDQILIVGTNGNSCIRSALYFDKRGNVVGGTACTNKDLLHLKFKMTGFIEKRIWS